MRVDARASRSWGNRDQSAVMKSSVSTARSAMTLSYVRASPITPTACTGSSTANAWATRRSNPRFCQLVQEDRIGLPQNLEPLGRHFAQAANRQPRPGERMAPDERVRQPQLDAQPADFVLEQVAQRLDQLEAKLLGKPADIVVNLDGCRRPIGRAAALDHVGIKRSLSEELRPGDRACLLAKDIDEHMADSDSFFLRVDHSLERLRETGLDASITLSSARL